MMQSNAFPELIACFQQSTKMLRYAADLIPELLKFHAQIAQRPEASVVWAPGEIFF